MNSLTLFVFAFFVSYCMGARRNVRKNDPCEPRRFNEYNVNHNPFGKQRFNGHISVPSYVVGPFSPFFEYQTQYKNECACDSNKVDDEDFMASLNDIKMSLKSGMNYEEIAKLYEFKCSFDVRRFIFDKIPCSLDPVRAFCSPYGLFQEERDGIYTNILKGMTDQQIAKEYKRRDKEIRELRLTMALQMFYDLRTLEEIFTATNINFEELSLFSEQIQKMPLRM